jgi:hypothetical protein
MTLMPANTAVWLRKKNSGRLALGPAPYPHPREHQIVVRTRGLGQEGGHHPVRGRSPRVGPAGTA